MWSLNDIAGLIKDVPDFPKKGVIYKDITPLLENGKAFSSLIQHLKAMVPEGTTKFIAPESRGFIFGSALAHEMGIGLVLVRKPGKLPRKVVEHSYDLEYGQDTLQIHKDALTAQDKVVLIDDVLATGGTAKAAEELCKALGAKVQKHLFLMEIEFLKGSEKLDAQVSSLLKV